MWQLTFLGYKIRIVHPEYLLFSLGVLVVSLGLVFAWLRRMRRVRTEVPARLVERVVPGFSPGREGARLGSILLGLVCLSLSLTQPQCGTGTELARKVGIDVVVAMDVSRSMLARDVKPSRFERARLELTELIDRLKGDRFGLVVFAGTSFVQCPLTTDYAAAKLFLKAVDPDAMPVQGTNLGGALRSAKKLLETREGARSQVVVLLTDGEDHSDDAIEAAHTLADSGIKIYAVGIGSTTGEPIPILDRQGAIVGYKKDREGNTVLSRLDPATLQKLADITGGKYVHARGGVGIGQVIKDLDHLQKAEFESRMTTRFEDRSVLLLLPGFLLLLFGTLLRPSRRAEPPAPAGTRRRPPGSDAGKMAAVVLLLISPTLLGWRPFQSQHPDVRAGNEAYAVGKYGEAVKHYDKALAKEKDPGRRARIEFDRGTALAAKGDTKGAKKAFDSALAGADTSLQAKDFYNLGTALLKTHDPKHAVDALVRSLKIDPTDGAAKHNLELALRALQKKKRHEKQDDQKKQQKNQKKNQQQKNKDQKQASKDQQKKQKSQQAKNDQKDQKNGKKNGKDQGQKEQAKKDQKQQQKDEAEQASGDQKKQQHKAGQKGHEEKKGGQKGDEQGALAKADKRGEVSKQDAARILKALERGEKPLQMQLFQMQHTHQRQTPPQGKDW